MTLTVGSLFSGIGGLDLGLERAGMEVIWQSEIDPYACKVLSKHWPQVPNHGNIKEINWGDIVRPDIICGGYPCQPFSLAGKRAGTNDPRHLWPWVRNAISELRPKYAILENVRGHLSMGGTTVIADLANIGYDAEWHIVSAASVGAPHRRDRIVIIAHTNDTGGGTSTSGTDHDRSQEIEKQNHEPQPWISGCSADVANPDSGNPPNGRQRANVPSEDISWGNDRSRSGSNTRKVSLGSPRQNSSNVADNDSKRNGINRTQETARQARFFRADNTRRETSNVSRQWWAVEPDVGRVANGVPNRVDRLRGLGNAVVPQVAELVGRMVMEHHNQ